LKGRIGELTDVLVAYSTPLWNQVAPHVDSFPQISGAVIFGDIGDNDASAIASSKVPQLHHLAGKTSKRLQRTKAVTAYNYPETTSYLFGTPFSQDFSYNMESVSHSRSLSFLKPLMNGPYFDLEVIWDEHTYWEFENRSVENTMSTMVQEPYVNHVPTVITLLPFIFISRRIAADSYFLDDRWDWP
jgi:carboxymethylenebutenolidase